MPAPPSPQPGTLRDVGVKPLGLTHYRWHECITCKTVFPSPVQGGSPTCNGKVIGRCPYCSEKKA